MSAASAPTRVPMPRIGWLLACSLWLLPVVFGFGITGWVGFAIIGILIMRMRWVLLAIAWFAVLAWLEVEPSMLLEFVQALSQGYVYDDVVIPLLVLYLGGILYGGHANKVWLLTLYERRVRGVRMLGWVAPQPVASRPNGVVARLSRLDAERAELLTRVATSARAYLAHEEKLLQDAMAQAAADAAAAEADAAAAEAAAEAPSPTVPAPWTSTPLPSSTLSSTTLLGLPSGPVDVRTASVEEIAAIPAIGLARAARLVAARETQPFASVDEVVQALGLSALDLVRARPYLKV